VPKVREMTLLCAPDGVPELVQRIRYSYGNFYFRAVFFNGLVRYFDAASMCPSIELLQRVPTRMQMLEAESSITRLAEKHWAEWADAG